MPKKPAATLGIIYRMPLEDLHPHPLNPYGVRDDPAMQELVGSVKTNGVLIPAIARPRKEGGYELISGHRRKYACEQLGQDTMPVMVLNLKDDDAIIRMIDSNIQRENILPSERAKAYKLKMEAVKRKAGRPQKDDEKNSPKISANFRSDDSIGNQEGISGDTIRNYISLTNISASLGLMNIISYDVTMPIMFVFMGLTFLTNAKDCYDKGAKKDAIIFVGVAIFVYAVTAYNLISRFM